jgi:hypothetical protein
LSTKEQVVLILQRQDGLVKEVEKKEKKKMAILIGMTTGAKETV